MLTDEQKEKIVEQAKNAMRYRSLSANAASKLIRISGATLSNMLNHKWQSINDDKWNLLEQWATPLPETVKTDGFEWKVRRTRDLQTVLNVCGDAQKNSRLLSVCAKTGFGKTTGLKYYCAENSNAYYVLCTVTMSRKDFIAAVQRAMGIEVLGSIHDRLYAVIHNLRKSHVKPLLCLDDMGKLNDACLRLVQIIYDELKGYCGIAFSGLPHLKNYIYKMAAKDKQGFPELKRRIAYWQPLGGPSPKFKETICAAYGITDEQAISYVNTTVQDYGTLEEVMSNYYRHHKGSYSQLEILTNLQIGVKAWEGAA